LISLAKVKSVRAWEMELASGDINVVASNGIIDSSCMVQNADPTKLVAKLYLIEGGLGVWVAWIGFCLHKALRVFLKRGAVADICCG
jgi:hypothetical protein